MPQQRRSFRNAQTFEQLSAEEAARFRKAADDVQGTARELLLARARQAEIASQAGDRRRSPGLKNQDEKPGRNPDPKRTPAR